MVLKKSVPFMASFFKLKPDKLPVENSSKRMEIRLKLCILKLNRGRPLATILYAFLKLRLRVEMSKVLNCPLLLKFNNCEKYKVLGRPFN